MESPAAKGDASVEVNTSAEVNPSTRSEPHRNTLEEYERLFGVDEDAYEQPTTTRKELWSYYLYYNGISQELWGYLNVQD